MQEKTHYEVLGIDQDAKTEDVIKAYRRLALIKHPDHGGDDKEFIPIQEAYEILSDEKRREEYDAIISREASTFVNVSPDFAGIAGDSKSLVCRSEINLTQLVATGCIDSRSLKEFCVANEGLALSVLNDPKSCSQLMSTFPMLDVFLAQALVKAIKLCRGGDLSLKGDQGNPQRTKYDPCIFAAPRGRDEHARVSTTPLSHANELDNNLYLI